MSERTREPSAGTPRLLTIMGSGETAPTMVKVHRQLLERVGGGPAVLLDTPYGFQENADDISEKAQAYFAASVGHPIAVARFRSRSVDALGGGHGHGRGRRGALRVRGTGQPHVRPAPVGRVATPLAARRQARTGHCPPGCGHLRQRRGPHAGRRDGARVRDLQGRPRPALARRTGPARRGDRPQGRRHPPLRQRRGRPPRHPVLLPGRAATGGDGSRARRRRVRARRRRAHRPRARPRCRPGLGARPGRRDRAPPRPRHRLPDGHRPGDRRPRRHPGDRPRRWATSRSPGRAKSPNGPGRSRVSHR